MRLFSFRGTALQVTAAILPAAGAPNHSLYNGETTPGTSPAGGYHHIIAGANGLYAALPGWD